MGQLPSFFRSVLLMNNCSHFSLRSHTYANTACSIIQERPSNRVSQQAFPPLLQKLEEFLFGMEENPSEVGYYETVGEPVGQTNPSVDP